MYYCSLVNNAVTIVSFAAMALNSKASKNKKTLNKCVLYVMRTKAFRNLILWADRNHLTGRSRDDVFYDTKRTLEKYVAYSEPSVISCFNPKSRLPKRPESMVSKFLFDVEHSSDPDFVTLKQNLKIRHAFRHYNQQKHNAALLSAKSAPANNHSEACTTRNAASILLADFKTVLDENVYVFSISGSKHEMEATTGCYRAHHQASDFAVDSVRDQILHLPPELDDNFTSPCVAIATDTLNHVSSKEKNALLGNGVSLISYNPTAMINMSCYSDVLNERVSCWKKNMLHTFINGGGDYVDSLWDTNYDIMVADCPDGDFMLVYIESWIDPFDSTHAFLGEIPFCKIHRRSHLREMIKKVPKIDRIAPLMFDRPVKSEKGKILGKVSYSMFNVKHADLVQITNNDTYETEFYKRSELVTLSSMQPGFAVTKVLNNDVSIQGTPRDNIKRKKFIEDMGLQNCLRFLDAPNINIPSPLTEYVVAQRILANFYSGDYASLMRPEVFRDMPENVRKFILENLQASANSIGVTDQVKEAIGKVLNIASAVLKKLGLAS